MELKHDFEVPTGLDEAWTFLLDIPRVASCLPGAELTEAIDDRNFKGSARVKVGPVALTFAGTAEIIEIDQANRNATVRAKGSDRKGRGNADATVHFALTPAGTNSTAVDVSTNLSLSGSVAQYGRASGLIDAVAKEIIANFVTNLESELISNPLQAGRKMAGQVADTEPRATVTTTSPKDEISGISLFFRALLRMVRDWFVPVRK